jgi:hypothetical protein
VRAAAGRAIRADGGARPGATGRCRVGLDLRVGRGSVGGYDIVVVRIGRK